jgi:hypothetical protein
MPAVRVDVQGLEYWVKSKYRAESMLPYSIIPIFQFDHDQSFQSLRVRVR